MSRNVTISYLSLHLGMFKESYSIPSVPLADPGQGAAADAFEVYLGALYQDAQARGEHHLVRDWLEKLWEQTIFPDFDLVLQKAGAQRKIGKPPPVASKAPVAVGSPADVRGKEETRDRLDPRKPEEGVPIRQQESDLATPLTSVKLKPATKNPADCETPKQAVHI